MKNPNLHYAGIRSKQLRFGQTKWRAVRVLDVQRVLLRRGCKRAVLGSGIMAMPLMGEMWIEARVAEQLLKTETHKEKAV